MSPIYIYDTGAKDPESYQIKYEWMKLLPIFHGIYVTERFGECPEYSYLCPSGFK